MMPDYPLGQTLDFKFTTRQFSTGATFLLAGSPVVEVYEDNDTTQILAGETLTANFDGIAGLNNLRIVATGGNGYEVGKSYAAIISVGTVDGVSVVGEVVAQFSIERSPALRPTTAGRTLDVTAAGEAGLDLDNTVGTLAAAQFGADFITAAKIADNAFLAVNFGAAALTAAKFGADFISAASIADNSIAGEHIATGAIQASTFAADAIDAAAIASNAGAKIRGTVTGTADSGSSTTMVDNALTQADDYWKGATIRFTDGTLSGQSRVITDFVASSDTVTFSPPVTTAVVTHTYELVDLCPDPWVRKLGNTTYSASAIAQLNVGVLGGKISGLSTTTATIRDVEDAANLIVATVDVDGNRSAVTITPPVD